MILLQYWLSHGCGRYGLIENLENMLLAGPSSHNELRQRAPVGAENNSNNQRRRFLVLFWRKDHLKSHFGKEKKYMQNNLNLETYMLAFPNPFSISLLFYSMQVSMSERLLCVAATVGLIGGEIGHRLVLDWSMDTDWKCYIITLLQVAKRLDTGWCWIHCPRLEMLQVARGPNIFNIRGADWKHIFGTNVGEI